MIRPPIREREPSLRLVCDPLDSRQTRSSTEDASDTFKRESDLIFDYIQVVPVEILAYSTGGVCSFVYHVSKWLYRQSLDSAVSNPPRRLVEDAIQSTCELISSKPSEDITLKAWNTLLDGHGDRDPYIWVAVLKAFVATCDLIPADTCQRLIQVGERSRAPFMTLSKSTIPQASPVRKSSLNLSTLLLSPSSASSTSPASNFGPASPSGVVTSIRDAFVPVLEDMPASRHSALASLCTLLSRDHRNRKVISAAFGPWLLLDSPNEESPMRLCASADTLEMMIALSDQLFDSFSMPTLLNLNTSNVEAIRETSQPSEDNSGGLKSLLKKGNSLKSALKRFGSSGKDAASNGSTSSLSNKDGTFFSTHDSEDLDDLVEFSAVTKSDESIAGLDTDLVNDVKDKPARSRRNLEREYGRAPPPPPPKQNTSPASAKPMIRARPTPIEPRKETTPEPSSTIPLSPLMDKSFPSLALEAVTIGGAHSIHGSASSASTSKQPGDSPSNGALLTPNHAAALESSQRPATQSIIPETALKVNDALQNQLKKAILRNAETRQQSLRPPNRFSSTQIEGESSTPSIAIPQGLSSGRTPTSNVDATTTTRESAPLSTPSPPPPLRRAPPSVATEVKATTQIARKPPPIPQSARTRPPVPSRPAPQCQTCKMPTKECKCAVVETKLPIDTALPPSVTTNGNSDRPRSVLPPPRSRTPPPIPKAGRASPSVNHALQASVRRRSQSKETI